MTARKLLVPLIACLLMPLGCNPNPPALPGSKAGFRGLAIKVLLPDRLGLQTWLNEQRGEWSAETGATVELVSLETPDPESSPRNAAERTTPGKSLPAGDIVIYPASQMGHLVGSGQIVKVPKKVIDKPDYERKDFGPAVNEHLISWDRQVYAVPLSAECLLVYYRKDLFEDENHREKFRHRFGRQLQVPATWDEFDDAVEFFDETDLDGDGTPDHCLTIADAGESLVCRAAAYGKPPQNFSFYFDVGTMEPLLAGPAFQEAMAKWNRLAHAMASEPSTDSIFTHFAAGRTALALGSSALAGQLLHSKSDRIQKESLNRVGCAPIPASTRVYLHDKQTWADLPADKPNRIVVADGLVASVLKASQQADAAFDFLTFLTNRERSLASVTTMENRLGPYRQSQLVDVAAWAAAGWSATATHSFLAAMRDSLTESNVVTVLRVDGAAEYNDALDVEILAAFRGDRSGTAALSAAADSWRAITERRDLVRQRRQYRYSLGMPVLN